MTSIYIILIIYLVILFAIGLYYSRKSKNMTDYLLAGRNLKLGVAVLTLTATLFGGGMLTGSAQYAYLSGSMIFFYSLGGLIGVCGVGLLAQKMKDFSSYTTVTEYLENRYNSPFLRLACSVLSMVALVGILGSQVSAVVGVFNELGFKNATLGAIVAITLIIALTVLGGLWAVTMTDCFQIILVVIGLIWVTIAALGAHGGFGNVLAQLNAVSASLPEDYLVLINREKIAPLMWALLPMVMYYLIGQDVYQRLFACQTQEIARKTAYITGILLFFLSFPPVILGMIARLDFPELAAAGTSSSAFATVAMAYLPNFAVGVVLAAALSAILSTADSVLTAATSHFINDIWLQFVEKGTDINSKKMLHISRLTSLIFGIFAVAVSLLIPEILTAMFGAYTLYTAGAFVPIVFGVMWKGTTKAGAISGMVVGSILAILGLSGLMIGEIPCELFSAAAAAVVTVVISLVDGKKRQIA